MVLQDAACRQAKHRHVKCFGRGRGLLRIWGFDGTVRTGDFHGPGGHLVGTAKGLVHQKKKAAQPGLRAYGWEVGSGQVRQVGEGDRVVGAVVEGEEGAKVAGVDLYSTMAAQTGWDDSHSNLDMGQFRMSGAR